MLQTDISNGPTLFGSYEPIRTTNNKIMDWLMIMHDLKYVQYDNNFRTLQFTPPGLEYFRRFSDRIMDYIHQNGIDLGQYCEMKDHMHGLVNTLHQNGILANDDPYFPIYDLSTAAHGISNHSYKMTEQGEIVADMNSAEFPQKAPGEMMA